MELVRAISRRQVVPERPDNFVRTHLDQVHRPGPNETEVQKSPRPTLPGLPAPPACFLTPRARRVCPGRVLSTSFRGPHPAGRAQAAWRAVAQRGRPVAAIAETRFCRFCRKSRLAHSVLAVCVQGGAIWTSGRALRTLERVCAAGWAAERRGRSLAATARSCVTHRVAEKHDKAVAH